MQHHSLAAGRWRTQTLLEQLGNIGSEVGRALRGTTTADRQAASYRALELFDLTLADPRWRNRGSEIARAREVVCDYLFGNNIYRSTDDDLERYFMRFALAARLDR
ncbi:hypothetical protein HY441_02175 [Candidatus Microgenomates bacterium]|nr:hypothetical protein [Candidatus Microgenomates bacterium]